MQGDRSRRAAHGIGALTRRDRIREAAINKKIRDSYHSISTTTSTRARRRHLRNAHRHERALAAQRRRPQSVLNALSLLLVALLVVLALTGASLTLTLIVGALLLVDARVLLHRRRKLRRH